MVGSYIVNQAGLFCKIKEINNTVEVISSVLLYVLRNTSVPKSKLQTVEVRLLHFELWKQFQVKIRVGKVTLLSENTSK